MPVWGSKNSRIQRAIAFLFAISEGSSEASKRSSWLKRSAWKRERSVAQ